MIFLIGVRQKETQELNGLETVSYYPTTEFEIILRDNLELIEIRRPYQVVRDFVATAILDNDNPMSAAKSYFIGEDDDVRNSLVKVVKQVISIDTLRERLDGAYKKLGSAIL